MPDKNLRSMQELHFMRNTLRQELDKLLKDTNPSLQPNYQARITHLKKSLQMVEDTMNFHSLASWLGGDDSVQTKTILESIRII